MYTCMLEDYTTTINPYDPWANCWFTGRGSTPATAPWHFQVARRGGLSRAEGQNWRLRNLRKPRFFVSIVSRLFWFCGTRSQLIIDAWQLIFHKKPGHLLWNKLNFVPITSDPNCATTSPPCQVCGRLPNAQVSWPGVTPKSQEGVWHGRQWIFAEGSIVARTSATLETEPLQRRTICRWQRPHESWYEFIRILANSYHKCSPYDFLVYDLIWVWGMQQSMRHATSAIPISFSCLCPPGSQVFDTVMSAAVVPPATEQQSSRSWLQLPRSSPWVPWDYHELGDVRNFISLACGNLHSLWTTHHFEWVNHLQTGYFPQQTVKQPEVTQTTKLPFTFTVEITLSLYP